MAKSRHKKHRHSKVRVEDLAPGIAAGYTEGLSEREALDLHPVQGKGGAVLLDHMVNRSENSRVPTPHFVAQEGSTGFVRESLGRRMVDAKLMLPPEVMGSIKAGMICLKCLEPQSHSFADEHIDGCEGVLIHGPHYMRDRQILDVAMETEGNVHIGPSKPMQEMLDEQDERNARRTFADKVAEGGKGKLR